MHRKCHWDIGRRMLKRVLKHPKRRLLLFLLFSLSGSLVLASYLIQFRRLFSGPCSIFRTESQKGRSIWTIVPKGRFGNQMGEYAALYALAKLNGHPAYIAPEMHDLLSSIFQISLPVLPQSVYTEICWREFKLHDWMSEEYKSIRGKYVQFTGYPCSWTFYHHIRKEIQREFSFHSSVKEEVHAYLEKLKGPRKNVTYIGVHVRRGDYIEVMPKIWKGVVADETYLLKAMTYFRKKYHQPIFVVASNGMQWCKDNIDTSKGDVYFSGDGKESSPWKDFALLAHCNHTIMTIGTFGYWAGYLAGGQTVYLTNFTLPDSPFLELFHYNAAFLPHWVGIPANLTPLGLNYTGF